jgi:two-component system chemotaxis response regulator CheY
MTLRALVVDDSLQLRRSMMYALQRLPDLVCVEAQDGAEALKKFSTSRFDLVITDINMPVLDGLKLIAHIRADASNAKVPIIVVSTEAAEADRQRALQLGADAYLVKPVKAQDVLDTVQSLLAPV